MTVLVGSSHFISSKVNKVFLFACTFWTRLDILNSAQMRIPHGVCEVIRALQWTNSGRFSPDSENDKRLLKILNTPLIFAQNINREYINIEPPDDPLLTSKHNLF